MTTLTLESLTIEIHDDGQVLIKQKTTTIESYDSLSIAIRENAVRSLLAELEGETEVAADFKAIAIALIKHQRAQ